MSNKKYIIRTATRLEVDLAIEWAAAEGWNPGLHDADCFYASDPNAFLIGLLGNKAIATISAIKYGNTFGFIGFYIVKPEYRGKGYGLQIWKTAVKQLGKRNIGLDGVVTQQENYKKSGFKLACRNMRYKGFSDNRPYDKAKILNLSALPFKTIEVYDRSFFPAGRSRFIKSWINQPESNALCIMQNGKLAGYGVIRRCRSGYKIGPLFADNYEIAESLFLALMASIKTKEPIYLDLPEVNEAAITLVNRYNMDLVFETARMYSANKPDIPLQNIFGLTSFEAG